MVIYGEYLFLENMVIGLLILYFTAKILGEPIYRLRFFLCGISCGAYAFVLFTNIHGILSLAGKSLFSVVMVFIAFGRAKPKPLLKKGIIFFSVTVLYGGIAIAILTSFGWTGVTAVGGVYLPPLSFGMITAVAACSAWLVKCLLDLIGERRMENRVITQVELTLCGQIWRLKGLIDSGNQLKEPISGKPVCIVKSRIMESLLATVDRAESRYTVIPYHGVGIEKSLLEGYRVDQITIEGRIWKSPILAVCEEREFLNEGEDLQILLPGVMLERGLNVDVS